MSVFIANFTISGSHFSYLDAPLNDFPSYLTAASTTSLSFFSSFDAKSNDYPSCYILFITKFLCDHKLNIFISIFKFLSGYIF
jgi:hypothetical protein